MMKQTVLPFKIAKSNEQITPNSGLSIYIGLYNQLGIEKDLKQLFLKTWFGKSWQNHISMQSRLI